MADENEEAPETSLTVRVDGSGITAGAKSRFIAAVDRLFGGIVGLPADWISAKRAQRQAHYDADQIRLDAANEARRRVLSAQVEAATDALTNGPNPLIEQLLEEQAEKADRLGGVLLAAEDALLRLPPPQDTPPTDKGQPIVDPDWLSFFRSYAERAASIDLQDLWGRVLAGEIAQPKSFGLSTLRVISEIDSKAATDFQELMHFNVEDWVLKPSGQISGEELLKWARVEEAGLISQGAGLGLNLTVNDSGGGVSYVRNGPAVLILKLRAGQSSVQFSVAKLTTVGTQIKRIVNIDPFTPLRAVAERLKGDLRGIQLAVVTNIEPNGRFHYLIKEELKADEPESS